MSAGQRYFPRVRLTGKSLGREDLVSELMTRKVRARLQANRILRDHYLRLQKAFDKEVERTVARLAVLAQKAQAKQLGRTGRAEVERLRGESMAVSRGRGLTKRKIRAEVDPRVEQLHGLLRPGLDDIAAGDKKIGPALDALRLRHAELEDWFAQNDDNVSLDKLKDKGPPTPCFPTMG